MWQQHGPHTRALDCMRQSSPRRRSAGEDDWVLSLRTAESDRAHVPWNDGNPDVARKAARDGGIVLCALPIGAASDLAGEQYEQYEQYEQMQYGQEPMQMQNVPRSQSIGQQSFAPVAQEPARPAEQHFRSSSRVLAPPGGGSSICFG